ncbi:MAG TPA: zinc-dependent metalloprotease [Mycobacteriales bacterium]|nr:zinc-dependent metalloprotease [Mycobacteriales bacterium]
MADRFTGTGMVDWDFAAATARRLMRPGPEVTRSEADAAVDSLRRAAAEADGHVRRLTGLVVPGADPDSPPPVSVVDRPGWVDANTAGLSTLMGPLITRLEEQRPAPPGRFALTVGSRVTGLQAGAVLAFLSGRVLGQFEIFASAEGRLLLVAPNVVEAERNLGVDPGDFRLWVCLHEVTHRVQFTAVPWLRGHLHEEIARLVEAIDLDPEALRESLSNAVRELGSMVRGTGDRNAPGLFALVQSSAQRAVLDRLTGVMSLLEGHAEHVMDAVGPEVVPSVERIRERFTGRRRGSGPLDRLLRRLLGLDLKMRQYADGRAFVSTVVSAVGMDGFNAVWTSPQTLPSRAEIAAPADWVERVHGIRPAVSA